MFAARCGARERERQLGNGYGFGIFVEPGMEPVRRRDQSVVRSTRPVPERLRGLLDRRGRGRQLIHARGVRRAVPLRLRGSRPCTAYRRRSSPATGPATGSPEKLGLRNEGVAVRYLEINGVWEDHVRYAITAEEWARPAGRPICGTGSCPTASRPGVRTGSSHGSRTDRRRMPKERFDVALVSVVSARSRRRPGAAAAPRRSAGPLRRS